MKRRPPRPVDSIAGDGGGVLVDFKAYCASVGVPVAGRDPTPPCGPEDDLAAARAAIGERFEAWKQWRAAREAHAAEHGWPGGEIARVQQERFAHPGEPFDPSTDL